MNQSKNKHDCSRCFLSFVGVYSITSQRHIVDEVDKTDQSIVAGKNMFANTGIETYRRKSKFNVVGCWLLI